MAARVHGMVPLMVRRLPVRAKPIRAAAVVVELMVVLLRESRVTVVPVSCVSA